MTKEKHLDRRQFGTGLAALIAAPVVLRTSSARAQAWPARPVTFVVNSDVGGSIDRTTRGLAQYMTEHLGQPIAVVNKPGAGTALGAMYVLNQPDDGYTVLAASFAPYISTSIVVGAGRYKLTDFAYMNAHWSDWDIIAAHKDGPYKTLPDLLNAIRDNPGKVRASVVSGSAGHLTTLMLLDRAGIPKENLNLVTYAGGGQARTAVAGGQVDFIVIAGDGSEGIRDFLHPLAVVRNDRVQEWDAPPVTEALKPAGIEIPVISGSMRGLVTAASFRQKHPDRWDRLLDAYKKTVESEAFQTFSRNNKMASEWLGPERTTEEVMRTHEVVEKYASVFKA